MLRCCPWAPDPGCAPSCIRGTSCSLHMCAVCCCCDSQSHVPDALLTWGGVPDITWDADLRQPATKLGQNLIRRRIAYPDAAAAAAEGTDGASCTSARLPTESSASSRHHLAFSPVLVWLLSAASPWIWKPCHETDNLRHIRPRPDSPCRPRCLSTGPRRTSAGHRRLLGSSCPPEPVLLSHGQASKSACQRRTTTTMLSGSWIQSA